LDRELVERAQRGDESAFATLAVRISDRLYATAHHILRDTDQADDAAQQAMIDIWRELPRLKDPDRFQAWAYRIVVRAAYAESRRSRRWTLPSLGLHSGTASGDDPHPRAREAGLGQVDHTERIADRDQLARGFERLPIDHRAVVVLKHFAGLSNEEIAQALEIPEGTVRSRLHHSLRQLRAALDADARLNVPGEVS
jgi:RNA polymerase sigma-70 factor (ECF subfamily)